MIRRVNYQFHPFHSIFYFCLATSIASSGMYYGEAIVNQSPTVYTSSNLIYIVVMALAGFLSQVLIAISNKLEKAGRVATMGYLQVGLAFIADIVIFGTKYHWNEILGGALILLFNLLVTIIRCIRVNQQ